MEIKELKLSEEFTKYHLDLSKEGWEHYQPLLHHFTGPDKGDPHDHPFDMKIYILKGWYIEKVYNRYGIISRGVKHEQGEVFTIKSEHIHKIIHVSEHCWTLAIPQPCVERVWGFWNFDGPKPVFSPFKP